MQFVRWLLAILALSAAGSVRAATLRIASAEGAAVPNAFIVFAAPLEPGPYPFDRSGAGGEVEIPSEYEGALLVLHPDFIPLEIAAAPSSAATITLHKGAPHPLPPDFRNVAAELRIYPRSWIGKYDVETLPLLFDLATSRVQFQKADGVIFDVTYRSGRRFVGKEVPVHFDQSAAVGAEVVTLDPDGGVADAGVVFLFEHGAATDREAVPRSRIVSESTRFEGLASGGRYWFVAAPIGFGPGARSETVTNKTRAIRVRAEEALAVRGSIRCDADVAVEAHFAPRAIGGATIPRRTKVDQDQAVVVEDLSEGTLYLQSGAEEHRPVERSVLVRMARGNVDAGLLCAGKPYLLQGLVTDERHRPIAGAQIRYDSASSQSGRDGDFELSVLTPEESWLNVSHPSFLPWKRWLRPTETTPAVDVRLSKGVTFRGRVIDAETTDPLQDFTLTILGTVDTREKFLEEPVRSADGSFSTRSLPRESDTVLIEATGYTIETRRLNANEASSDLPVDLGVIALRRGESVRGRLVAESGPVAGSVAMRRKAGLPAEQGRLGFSRFTARVGDDGVFTIEGVPHGSYTVVATAADLAPREEEIDVTGSLDVGDLRLSDGCSLTGIVVTDRGDPVNATPVELRRAGYGSTLDVRTTHTDAEGAFVLEHVAAGSYTVKAPEYIGAEVTAVMDEECAAAKDTKLVVGDTSLVATVTLRGVPLANTLITMSRADQKGPTHPTTVMRTVGAKGEPVVAVIAGHGASAVRARTDSTGAFEVARILPGRYRVTAPERIRGVFRDVDVDHVPRASMRIELTDQPLRGRVYDIETTRPVANALLQVRSGSRDPHAVVKSDAGGWFELSADWRIALTVRVSAPEYEPRELQLEPDRPPASLDVGLRRSQTSVEGVVRSGAVPAAHAQLRWLLLTPAGSFTGAASADASGHFRIEGLAAGTLVVAAYHAGGGVVLAKIQLRDGTTDDLHPQIASAAPVTVAVPHGTLGNALRVILGGIDVTPLISGFPGLQPIEVAPARWRWPALPPVPLQLVAGRFDAPALPVPGQDIVVDISR